MNSNVLTIDGDLSDFMSCIICDELSQSSCITCMYFIGPISAHSLQLILGKVALIQAITDVFFAQGYTSELISVAVNALSASYSKKTIWVSIDDAAKNAILKHNKDSLITVKHIEKFVQNGM